MSKFTKYFKRSLISEADEAVVPMDDATTFKQDFENPESVQQLDAEITNASITPEQRVNMLTKADKYAEKINNIILPMLRNLHDSIVSGEFKAIAPDISGISNITEDLAALSESLRGKTRDALIKQDTKDSKNIK